MELNFYVLALSQALLRFGDSSLELKSYLELVAILPPSVECVSLQAM